MILRRPPHAAHSLMSEETPAPAGSPTAADGRRTQRSHRRPSPTARQPAWPPRCARGPGPGGARTRGSAGDETGRGNQSRQLLQQFHPREQERAGPIRPRRFEREGKRVGIDKAQTPPRQGRPGHVAAQAFESPPVRAGDPRCRMQPKAARSKAQGRRTHPGGRIFQDPAQRRQARAPVAVIPRTEAAVRAASTGSSSVSGSAAVSSSRPRLVHKRMIRRALVSTVYCTAWSDNGGAGTKTGASSPST